MALGSSRTRHGEGARERESTRELRAPSTRTPEPAVAEWRARSARPKVPCPGCVPVLSLFEALWLHSLWRPLPGRTQPLVRSGGRGESNDIGGVLDTFQPVLSAQQQRPTARLAVGLPLDLVSFSSKVRLLPTSPATEQRDSKDLKAASRRRLKHPRQMRKGKNGVNHLAKTTKQAAGAAGDVDKLVVALLVCLVSLSAPPHTHVQPPSLSLSLLLPASCSPAPVCWRVYTSQP